ncbi:MAG: tRNA preQ1(34) S-adenosylmethionine ribosyltransferase-isomerase QueA [Hyphomicrobiales bacterium]
MQVSEFDFDLPNELIALRPANPRDASRLLIVEPEKLSGSSHVRDFPEFLRAGDIIVFNDTKVIPARLKGHRIGRGDAAPAIEITLHMRVDAETWKAFAKPGRKLKEGDTLRFGDDNAACEFGHLDAEVLEKGEGGEITLRFSLTGQFLDEAIATHGIMPLPPYIASKRAADDADIRDYQTTYSANEGAVAAPTAGLHFTPDLMDALRAKGVELVFVTLHVGAGTFLPVKADDTADHKMHSEWGEITPDVAEHINVARKNGGRVIAAGTTSLRLLESATDEAGTVHPFADETDIFITPGYQFRAVDLLLTNFHLPRSTLFMLVSAFSGLERMQSAYKFAIEEGFRFYSYGDACLLSPAQSIDQRV